MMKLVKKLVIVAVELALVTDNTTTAFCQCSLLS